MENLIIEGSHTNFFIPSVDFNAKTGLCQLSGESFLEDTINFYNPILDWIDEYIETVQGPIAFIIKLTYFNTSTSRSILDILNILKDYQDEGGEVVVNWHFDENDVDMEEDIDDYIIDTGLEIQKIPF